MRTFREILSRSHPRDGKNPAGLESLCISSILAATAVPAFILDSDGKVAFWNSACEELTGIEAAAVVGTKDHWKGFYPHSRPCLADIALKDNPDEIAALYAAQDRTKGKGLRAQNWCDLPRGGRRYLLIDACKIEAPDGTVAGVLETLIDHTDIETARLREESSGSEQASVVSQLGSVLRSLAGGDLTVRLPDPFPTPYEPIRNDFNNSATRLCELISAVVENTEEITGQASELSGLSESLAERVRQQAHDLDQSTTAIRSLNDGMQETMNNTMEVKNSIGQSAEQARNSTEIVSGVTGAMERIKEMSSEIEKMLSMINGIAMQTNLLALNAGVEAARAGEKGLGFAVVATEIRDLAQRSAKAGGDISALVEQSGLAVQEGGKLVGQTDAAFVSILQQVQQAEKVMSGLMEITAKQTESLSLVSVALERIDGGTQQNSALAAQSFTANKELEARARTLKGMLSQFNIDDAKGTQTDDSLIAGRAA
jgi:methyl-accepting chemotaxis protein